MSASESSDRRDVEIRPARDLDREAWLALRCALWPGIDHEVHRREIVAVLAERPRRAALLGVDSAGARVALIEITRRDRVHGCDSEPVGYVEGIYVIPAMRGRGLAAQLLDAAERWAQSRGCRELAAHAEIDDGSSQALHERLGFTQSARFVTYRKPVEHQLARSAAAAVPSATTAAMSPVSSRRDPGRPIGHYAVLAIGIASFLFTDLWSGSMVRGFLLPVLDFAFVVYLLFWFVSSRYRARTDAGARASEMFGLDADPPADYGRAAPHDEDPAASDSER